MPSKFDLLREGKSIEFEPGVSGRLNPKTRKLELSTGEVLDAENDPDFFPQNQKSLAVSRQKEHIQKNAKGPVGEFLHQYTSQGIPGSFNDMRAYLTQTGEEYANRKQAEQEVSQSISEESPYISAAATGANIATDFALTRGMSAMKAAPLLTLGSAGSRIITDPQEVIGEAALAAGGGKALDLVGGYFNRVASRRGASRAIPGQQAAVREANTEQFNAFNTAKQNVKNVNKARLQQHQGDLNSRNNQIIQSQNNQKRYDQSVKEMPRLQAEAQKQYSNNVINSASEIERKFPRGSKIASSELDIPGFIDTKLSKTGFAGTKEGAQVSRILKSLFPEGESITAKEIASRYKAIEEAIQRASPEIKNILNDFKTHIGDRLPNILSNNMSYERVVPSLQKQLEKDIEATFRKFPSGLTVKSNKDLEKLAKVNSKKYFDNLTPPQFVEKMKNGQFRQEILDNLFSDGGKNIVNAEGKLIGTRNLPDYVKVLEDIFSSRLDKQLAKAELKMIAVETDAARRLGRKVRQTTGIAPPITPPPQPPMSVIPPIPPRPALMSDPMAPIPQAMPTLPPAQGMAEMTGDLLERPILQNNGGMKGQMNNLMKLGGLKYLLGSAALPGEAAYLGMKGLTSPTAGGAVARLTFKQGGIEAINSWAERYPSYNNGILEAPQDRRSLTKEIEDAEDIPIEQKAVIQSKVNRGKRLQESL